MNPIEERITLEGVRDHNEGYPVALERDEESGRLVIVATNEGGCNETRVDLLDLLECLRASGLVAKLSPAHANILAEMRQFRDFQEARGVYDLTPIDLLIEHMREWFAAREAEWISRIISAKHGCASPTN